MSLQNIRRILLAGLVAAVALLVAPPAARAQQMVYSDGQSPIQVSVNYTLSWVDAGQFTGVAANQGRPISLLPVSVSGANPGITITQINGPATIGGGVRSGNVYTSTFAVVPAGVYNLVVNDEYYVPTQSGINSYAYSTTITSVDSYSVLNPKQPPKTPNEPQRVAVVCTRTPATKGEGKPLKFVFTRLDSSADGSGLSQPLTITYNISGTAPSNDYTLSPTGNTITFKANDPTSKLLVTPVANGIYDSGVTVDIQVAAGSGYIADSRIAEGVILSPDRPPVTTWVGATQVSGDTWSQTVVAGQPVTIRAHAHDEDADLAALFVDSGNTAPPAGGGAGVAYVPVSGADGEVAPSYPNGLPPGTYPYSARSIDTHSVYSATAHLNLVVTNRPPTVQWAGVGGVNANADVTIFLGQSVPVRGQFSDPDGNLVYAAVSSSLPGGWDGADGPFGPNTSSYIRTFNGGSFRPTVPGDYYFAIAASDGYLNSPTITLHVNVPNRAPTIAWSVPGIRQINGNVWELDLSGTAAAPTIAAVASDPDNRLYATLVNRGVVDPSQNQGTPFAHVPGGYAGNAMSLDEMMPPLQTTLDSAVWEIANQDNYSWFSASAQDLDGGTAPPIHLLVRVFNNPPSLANWTAPAGASALSATDRRVTVNVNGAAFPIATLSSDPERKMWAAIISRGYQNPVAGNGDGQEVGVAFAADGITAAPSYLPGAETFDVPGDHWFSSTGIDLGSMYSGGNTPQGTHLDVQVVNRPPTAAFDANATTLSSYAGGTVHLRGVGNDPDAAMKRTQITLVSAPPAANQTPNKVLVDQTAPANTQTYPSNLPTFGADADTPTPVSGAYVYRVTVWDRHGGTASIDQTILAANRPPTFAWTQAEIHVLAGQAATLPFSLSDPDGNLGYGVAAATNYSSQVTATNGSNFTGSFSYPTTTAGTFLVTGRGYDSEGLASVNQPTIKVVVEPIDSAPLVYFTLPEPGGTSLKITRFVGDRVDVTAEATDVDNNIDFVSMTLDNGPWAQSSSQGADAGKLSASNYGVVPALGAESEHVYTVIATATDKGTVAGGTIAQTPRTSAPAKLVVTVPNRAPTVTWSVPTGGVGLTQQNPFVGHLLQPLRVVASGADRDGNLATTTITQIGGSGTVVVQKSKDGWQADAIFDFTPSTPGMYVFATVAADSAGLTSGDPLNLYVRVEDYPGEDTGTIGALVVSPASSPDQVFSATSLPVIVKGGIAVLGRNPVPDVPTAKGATKIIPVPSWLNGSQIPPLTPALLDLRTSSVVPSVDHTNPTAQ